MEYIIKGREPAGFFRFFEEISAIPRGSGNEAAIAAYIENFASERSLYCVKDDANNVFIRKEASEGYENVPALLLQGHTDMVCEKNTGYSHDFESDPLELYEENGMFRARGTTLGADDGAAVAAMLWLLDDETVCHPVLECLFTSGEETSLYGAHLFDCSLISARRIINLDTEKEGEAIASCAGSADITLSIESDTEKNPFRSIEIIITGLSGGHSGTDINSCRASAIRLMGRLLAHLYDEVPFNLVSLSGGNKRNAIARECRAVIIPLDAEKASDSISHEAERIRKELSQRDSGFRVYVNRGKNGLECFSYRDTSAIINMMTLLPNGPVAMSPSMEGFVRTSVSVGVARCGGGKAVLDYMARSSCDSELDALILVFKRGAKAIGASFELSDRALGWDFDPESALASDYKRIYKKLFPSSEPVVTAVHAGLECGIFVSALKDCDAISIGPTIYDIHSPDEALDIASCERFCATVRAMVEDKGTNRAE